MNLFAEFRGQSHSSMTLDNNTRLFKLKVDCANVREDILNTQSLIKHYKKTLHRAVRKLEADPEIILKTRLHLNVSRKSKASLTARYKRLYHQYQTVKKQEENVNMNIVSSSTHKQTQKHCDETAHVKNLQKPHQDCTHDQMDVLIIDLTQDSDTETKPVVIDLT